MQKFFTTAMIAAVITAALLGAIFAIVGAVIWTGTTSANTEPLWTYALAILLSGFAGVTVYERFSRDG